MKLVTVFCWSPFENCSIPWTPIELHARLSVVIVCEEWELDSSIVYKLTRSGLHCCDIAEFQDIALHGHQPHCLEAQVLLMSSNEKTIKDRWVADITLFCSSALVRYSVPWGPILLFPRPNAISVFDEEKIYDLAIDIHVTFVCWSALARCSTAWLLISFAPIWSSVSVCGKWRNYLSNRRQSMQIAITLFCKSPLARCSTPWSPMWL